MHAIELKLPTGMRLLPPLPTVEALFKSMVCRLSASFVQTLEIPQVQRDFLCWPGLPGSEGAFTLNLNWHPEIHFCLEGGQLRFAELYQIFTDDDEGIFMERFTGFLWLIERERSPRFVASGLEEFFLLPFVILGEYGSDSGRTTNDPLPYESADSLEEDESMDRINHDFMFLTYDDAELLAGMIDPLFRESEYFDEP